MTILPPEPPDEPGFSDSSLERDDVPNDALSDANLGRQETDDYFYGAHDSEGGSQRSLSIGDGDTFVTDEDLEENTAVNISDPDLARDVAAMDLDPDQGLFTEDEVLGSNQSGEDDDGLDPVPVA